MRGYVFLFWVGVSEPHTIELNGHMYTVEPCYSKQRHDYEKYSGGKPGG